MSVSALIKALISPCIDSMQCMESKHPEFGLEKRNSFIGLSASFWMLQIQNCCLYFTHVLPLVLFVYIFLPPTSDDTHKRTMHTYMGSRYKTISSMPFAHIWCRLPSGTTTTYIWGSCKHTIRTINQLTNISEDQGGGGTKKGEGTQQMIPVDIHTCTLKVLFINKNNTNSRNPAMLKKSIPCLHSMQFLHIWCQLPSGTMTPYI